MRISLALALSLALAVSACGDDEAEPGELRTAAPRSAPQQPTVDTALGDTATDDTSAGETGPPGAGQGAPDGVSTGAATPAAEAAPEAAGAVGAKSAAAGAERLYTVQVAAFTDLESARAWTARLQRQNLPAWTSMTELEAGTFYRVRVGASPSFSDARALGGMIAERYDWPVWIAPVTPADGVPDETVSATRRLMRGG